MRFARTTVTARVRALRSGIVFTRVREDHEVDAAGLQVAPGDRVVMIGSAGDKALDAALAGASEVVAADVNPAQLHLIALKVAAFGTLDWPTVWELFGVGRLPGVRAIYAERLRPVLAPSVRRYWDRHVGIFEVGLHGHNPLGVAIGVFGWIVRRAVGSTGLAAIVAVSDARSQGGLWERRYRRRLFNPLTRRLAGGGILLRSVALNAQEREAMQQERFLDGIEERVSRLMSTVLIRDNPYWMPIVTGQAARSAVESPWLRPESFETLRRAVDVVALARGSVVDVLAGRAPGSLEAVDLSNVPDWLPQDALSRLWRELERVLVPDGRALVRSALRHGPRPPVDGALVVDAALSATLTERERTALYGSVVALRKVR